MDSLGDGSGSGSGCGDFYCCVGNGGYYGCVGGGVGWWRSLFRCGVGYRRWAIDVGGSGGGGFGRQWRDVVVVGLGWVVVMIPVVRWCCGGGGGSCIGGGW